MNSCELIAFISSIACTLSRNCSREELSVMAAVFTQLGDTLATIAVHDEFCNNKDFSDGNNDNKELDV